MYFFSDNSNDGGQWLSEKKAKWEALMPGTMQWGRISEADIKKCLNRPSPNTRELLVHSHNQCRDFVLATGADFAMHIECDVLGPTDSLLTLIDHARNGIKVVGGAYHHGYGTESYVLTQHSEKHGSDRYAIPLSYGVSDMLWMDGHTKKMHSCGLGYTLIHKSVLQAIPFRYEKPRDVHPDTCFFEDLELMGIQPWQDTSILCDHYNVKWDEVDFTMQESN